MKQTKLLMGMPISIEIIDTLANQIIFDKIYAYFEYIDNKFSTYKKTSEITEINEGKIEPSHYSRDMATIFKLCRQTKNETNGYFDIQKNNKFDPLGLVKGWAIYQAAKIIRQGGYKNFYIEAGGDIQAWGKNAQGGKWRVGIRNPFDMNEIVKIVAVSNEGVATSGTYIRGQHIRNPKLKKEVNITDNNSRENQQIADIVSLTIIGPNIYEADRFATAAFAMGRVGINFIEKLKNFEGYLIDNKGIATFTTGFEKYIAQKP